MHRKLMRLAVAIVLALGVPTLSWAVSQFDATPMKVVDKYTGKIIDYAPKRVAAKPIAWGDDLPSGDMATPPGGWRRSLGAAAAPRNVSSPGLDVYYTYMDDQYRSPGKRMIDFRGVRPDIHFVYSRNDAQAEDSRFAYNVYNPVTGTWPRGFQVGCVLNAIGESGQHAVMDVNGRSRVVIGGADNTGGAIDNHFFWQSGAGAPANCTFGAGSQISQSQYQTNFLTPTISNHLWEPIIEVQEWAGDTITHVMAKEELLTPNDPDLFGNYTLNYFRKLGTAAAGTWLGPVLIDTVNNISSGNGTHNGGMAASRVSPKVAVAYPHWKKSSPLTAPNQLRYDNDLWYRVSDSVGAVWGPKINLTNYSRVLASQTAKLAVNLLYDHEGFLHIVFDCQSTVANVYTDNVFFWGDFSTNIFHWSDRTNQIAKVHNADWGIDFNSQVCGMGSPGGGYAHSYTMSECEGRIYVVFSQYLNALGDDVSPTTPQNIDDCASGGTSDRRYAANAELYMVVSKDLDGILWDAARNISKTYTPDCDSAGFGGVCMNDSRSSLSRYGMDADVYDTNGIPVVLKWPAGDVDLVDLTPPAASPDTGNNYIMMMYSEDHFPAPGYRDRNPDGGYTYGRLTLNPLRFVRLACVEPVNAPRILTDTSRIGYPAFTHHGTPKVLTVTVTNEGNAALNISKIGMVKTTQVPNDWLAVTNGNGMTVPAGIPNTNTFDVTLNKGGVINSPGTIVNLSGSLYIKSDAKAPRDSINIVIDRFLVADTVAAQSWDTVSTGCLRLVVSNNGEMGRNGLGGTGKANLDFWTLGSDCDTLGQSRVGIYLYDGGVVVNREITPGSAYSWSNQLFELGFDTDESFKPVVGGVSGSFTGTGFDGYRTGTFVNRDTTIGVSATYYAPTAVDSCNFIIVEKKYFNMKASPVDNVTVGEQIDWDVPSDSVATNTSKILGTKTVYSRGTDTGTVPDCGTQRDSSRYGAMFLLGRYTKSEFTAEPCSNTKDFYSALTYRQDTLYLYDSLSSNAEGKFFWNLMGNTGLTAQSGRLDHRAMYTYYHKRNFAVNDTVTVYTALITEKTGSETTLGASFDKAFKWYNGHLRPTCNLASCCLANSIDGRSGNVDADPAKGVDIADLSALIDFLYISFTPPQCLTSANIDGDIAGGIDIADLSGLIDYLYISFTLPALCQ